MSARIQVQGDVQHLDVQVYQARKEEVESRALRDALKAVHTAVLAHMITASYVDVYRKCLEQTDEVFASLVPPPVPTTQTNMEQLETALTTAQEVTLKATSQGDDVKITSSQRVFMQSFYTFQLRALDAAWKCLVWLSADTRKTLLQKHAEMRTVREKCTQWRHQWNTVMRPVHPVTTESPQDVVLAWCASTTPVTMSTECSKFAAQANALERTVSVCLSDIRGVQIHFESAAQAHLQDIELLKDAEVAKLNPRAVPVELEAVWLKNYLAHVRDFLFSHPELNLFL